MQLEDLRKLPLLFDGSDGSMWTDHHSPETWEHLIVHGTTGLACERFVRASDVVAFLRAALLDKLEPMGAAKRTARPGK